MAINDGIPPFWGWTDYAPVIPKMYWDVYSQEERIKRLCRDHDKLIHYASYLAELIGQDERDVDELQRWVKKFITSGFNDYYAKQVATWIDEHLRYVFYHVARQVWFGLSLDGHFVAYIPDGWSDIEFDTGADYSLDTYGRLMLRWDADSPDNVDQTHEVMHP